MQNDLLNCLKKYRPREGRDSLENFFTESFGWILKNHSGFSSFFLNEICGRLGAEYKNSAHNWDTQSHFDGFYPDMVCTTNDNTAYVFENKVWSPLHENQLENYRRYARKQFKSFHLILITANESQHDQKPDLAICWKDVHRWVRTWLSSTPKANAGEFCIFESLINLIEHTGLGVSSTVSNRLDMNLLKGIQSQSLSALDELNRLALKGLICKTKTKKQQTDDYDIFYSLKEFYYCSEIGRRGIWKDKDRPCIKWKNRRHNDEYLNLDNIVELNKNLALLNENAV